MLHDSLIHPVETNNYRHSNKTFKVIQKDAAVSDLFYTDDIHEKVKVRMDGPGTNAKNPPITLHTAFAKCVEKSPNNIALQYKYNHDETYKSLTFLQYYLLCCQAAKGFMAVGVESRHSVCIAGFNSPPWHISYFGAIFCGAVASGVYTTNTAETVLYILNNCNCQVAVVENEEIMKIYLSVISNVEGFRALVQFNGTVKAELKSSTNIKLLSWSEFMKLGESIPDKDLHAKIENIIPNECCSLIYTSGTTGNPKGVMMSHDNLLWTANSLLSCVPFRNGMEHLISYLPLSHVAAQMCDIVLPLMLQATISFAQPDALKGSLGTTLKEVHPTYFIGVPRVFEKMQESMKEMAINHSNCKKKISAWAKDIGLRHNLAVMNKEPTPSGFTLAKVMVYNKVRAALGLDRCRGAFSAAAPLALETQHYFASLNIVICEIYGMSECSGPQTVGTHDKFRFGSVGQLVPDFKMKLHKSESTSVTGKEGEICMSGRHVFMGYLGAMEKTKEVFDADNWLHSGDIGTVDGDGYLYITGRIKELLITAGGENVAPVPIEVKIKEYLSFVSQAIVVGDKKKFLTLLISIKCDMNNDTQTPTDVMSPATIRYCQSKGYKGESVSKLIADHPAAIVAEIEDAIKETNKVAISRASHIQKWKFLPTDLSVGNGELGPTLKVKRGHVVKQYEKLIDTMYTD